MDAYQTYGMGNYNMQNLANQGWVPISAQIWNTRPGATPPPPPSNQGTATPPPTQNTPPPTQQFSSNSLLNFLNQGYDSIDEIARISGMSLDEVNNFLNSNYAASNILARNKIMNQLDAGYKDYLKKINDLNNGIFTLSADEQAQIDYVKRMFDELREKQITANKNFEGSVLTNNVRSGMQEFMNETASGLYKQAVDDGIKKVKDIEMQALAKISELKDLFKDKRYKQVGEAYQQLSDYLKQKSQAISEIYAATKDYYEQQQKAEEFAYKKQQDEIINQFKFAEFELKQAEFELNSNKFSYQQKQDMIKNALENDKFTWQQKQDLIKSQLEREKFNYQQSKDAQEYDLNLQKYLLDVEKAKAQDTAANRREWELSGGINSGRTYDEFLLNKGRVSDKPPTADQERNAGFAVRMQDAHNSITLLTKQFMKLGLLGQAAQQYSPTFLKSKEGQMMEQAERDFVNAILRRESGAAISPTEFSSAKKQYFPQPGDSKEVILQKERNRLNALRGVSNASGTALSDEFKNGVGKITFPNLQSYIDHNPDKVEYIKQIRKEFPKWTPDDVLQFLQSESESESMSSAIKKSSSKMRTDRHNNPTAFTTNVAKQAGLVLGKDYEIGDAFPNNSSLKTARLIGDPIKTTIKVIDKIGLYKQNGQPRWTYVNSIPKAKQWNKLSYNEKVNFIKQMYRHEGGTDLLAYFNSNPYA